MFNKAELELIKESLSYQVNRIDDELTKTNNPQLREHKRTNLINTLTLLQKINNNPLDISAKKADGDECELRDIKEKLELILAEYECRLGDALESKLKELTK